MLLNGQKQTRHGILITIEVPNCVKTLGLLITSILFNKSFSQSKIPPDIKGKGNISPIQLNSTGDTRDPVNYRGRTIASAVYNIIYIF